MKVFLSATGVGAVCLGTLNTFGLATLTPKPMKLVGNIIGGSMVGIGMAIGGACPGTVFAQFGAGVNTAPWTVVGGLLGALTYGFADPHIADFLYQGGPAPGSPSVTLDNVFGLSFSAIAIPMGVTFIAMAYLFEYLFPSTRKPFYKALNSDQKDGSKTTLAKLSYWDPIHAGIGVGLMQLVAQWNMGRYLSTSSAYVSFSSAILAALLLLIGQKAKVTELSKHSYFGKHWITKLFPLWQVCLDFGMIAGGYIGGSQSIIRKQNRARKTPTVLQKVLAVVAGWILIFGARTTMGCTSGHGISGMAMLSVASFISVAFNFIGGMGISAIPGLKGVLSAQYDKVNY